MSRQHRLRKLCKPGHLTLAVMALSASLAAAQQAPADPATAPDGERASKKLEAVTVTVQRIRQNLQDVPASVTAFTASAMEDHQIQSATDLSRLVPNVKFDNVTGGSTGLRPFIRGGGVTDGGQITSESEVGIYVDDVYRARLSGALMEFIELERIEVLRGPQGVLYGRNSSAGALSIVTRAPSPRFTASTELGVGSNGLQRIKGYVSSALTDDKRWRGSLQGMYSSRDSNGQFNVTKNKRVGAEDFTGAQADLAYEGPLLKARFSAFYTHTDGDGQWAVPNTVSADGLTITPSTGSYRKVASPTDSLTDVKQTGQTLRLSTDLGGVHLVSITGHVRMDDHWRQDFSGGVSGALIGGSASSTLALFERDSVTAHRQFSQELQASGDLLGGRLSYVSGLYYFNESGNQDIATSIFFTPSTVRFNAHTTSHAVFGQLSGKLSEATTVQLGGRYSTDDKRLDGTMSGAGFDETRRFSKFTPKIGIDHKLAPGTLLYAGYSQGFKAGGYNGLASTLQQIRTPFLPQTTDAYELGLKADLLDRTLRLNASLFHNKISNRQQTLTVAAGPSAGSFVVENYNAALDGLEAEATWHASAGLTLWANGAINRSKYTGCSTAVTLPCSVIDNQLPVVPRHAFTVGFDHQLALGAGQLTYGADYSARAAFFSTADNALIGAVPRQKFLNAHLSYSLDAWSLQLAGKNLLQQQGWQTGFGFSVVQPRYAIPGRTLQLNLRYQY